MFFIGLWFSQETGVFLFYNVGEVQNLTDVFFIKIFVIFAF